MIGIVIVALVGFRIAWTLIGLALVSLNTKDVEYHADGRDLGPTLLALVPELFFIGTLTDRINRGRP